MKRDCSHSVSPGGGATPPTITSPTSPSAWAATMWMSFELRMDLKALVGPIEASLARVAARFEGESGPTARWRLALQPPIRFDLMSCNTSPADP